MKFDLLPPRPAKKHFVTVQGKQFEVSLKEKLLAIQRGEHNYVIEGGKAVYRPANTKLLYNCLVKSQKGYAFQDNDIHWPNGVVQGGHSWQKK